MRTRASLVIVGVLCTIGVWCAEEKTVQTKNGLIGGVRETSHQHSVDFYAFRGIPFARPPIGRLRFKVSFGCILFLPMIFCCNFFWSRVVYEKGHILHDLTIFSRIFRRLQSRPFRGELAHSTRPGSPTAASSRRFRSVRIRCRKARIACI